MTLRDTLIEPRKVRLTPRERLIDFLQNAVMDLAYLLLAWFCVWYVLSSSAISCFMPHHPIPETGETFRVVARGRHCGPVDGYTTPFMGHLWHFVQTGLLVMAGVVALFWFALLAARQATGLEDN